MSRSLVEKTSERLNMSILAGPFERREVSDTASHEEEEEFLMFGYACKLYRDDAKALMENSGQLLIPWMGDHSLMVDRYDVRNRLEDKNQFGLKSNLPYRPTAEEVVLEEELDRERYLALEWDDIRVAEQEEEEKKRQKESAFSAVGFSYNNSMSTPSASKGEVEDPPLLACFPQRLEHPPTSSVDQGEDEEEYAPPAGLIIPNYLKIPTTNKLHSVIEKTALFIVKQGPQMEIVIKAKQKFNPFFSFLNHNDDLFPYYCHVKDMLQRGAYIPRQSSPAPPSSRPQEEESSTKGINGTSELEREKEESVDSCETEKEEGVRTSGEIQNKNNNSVLIENEESDDDEDDDDSDSDDDGGYLHPLLMGGGLKSSSKSSTPTPGTRESSPSVPTTTTASENNPKTTTAPSSVAYTTSSIAFYSKRMSINSAPIISSNMTPAEPNGPPRLATSTSGAFTASEGIQHQPQYSYGSSVQEGYPPSSTTSYAEQFERNSYDYQHSVPTQGQHVETSGVQYSDAYSAAQSQQHYPQYAQDGGYYTDSTQSTTADGTTQHYDYQAYYYQSADGQYHGSAYSSTPPTPPPPPPDILSVVTKTAEYVAKNGDAFERTVIERHAGDPRFGFINPWDKSHAYYQMLKQQYRQRLAYEAYSNQMGWNQNPGMGVGQSTQSSETNKENVSEPNNLQRLSESGTVSFKLQTPKTTSVFDPSSLVDLGTSEDPGEELPPGVDLATLEDCNGYEDDGAPPSKKPRVEQAKMGTKVEEFLTTVKAMFGTE